MAIARVAKPFRLLSPKLRRYAMTMLNLKLVGCLALVGAIMLPAAVQAKNTAGKNATTQPREQFGKMPATIDQAVKQQNSPQDMLQVDITHSQVSDGKYISYVRVVWGDLDNQIKGIGKQYYSDWDGNLAIDSGTGEIVRKIAFDDHDRRATTRPAKATKRVEADQTATEVAKKKARKQQHLVIATTTDRGEPRPGSGRDKLDNASGSKIFWQAGVVGAYDGLLIQITSDKPDVSAMLTAGRFTVPLKITAGPN